MVDGASSWQRFWKITLPLIKPALMVALLFRTLDAFRIYDTVFIMTRGANNTQTVSVLGYEQLVNRLNLGLGSTDRGADLLLRDHHRDAVRPAPRREPARGGNDGRSDHPAQAAVGRRDHRHPGLHADPGHVDPVAVVQDARDDRRRPLPAEPWTGTTTTRVQHRVLQRGAAQLDRHRADHDGRRTRRSPRWRPTPSPAWISRARTLFLAGALAVSMFPAISIVGGLFNVWRNIGLYDTWLGLILPYLSFSLPLSIYTLSAFFREIPWDLEKAAAMDGATPLQSFRRVILPLAMPGVFTAGILTFISAWNDFLFANVLTSTDASRTLPVALAFFRGRVSVHRSERCDRGRCRGRHDPDPDRGAALPTSDRRRPHRRRGQGLERRLEWQTSSWTTSPSAIPTASRPSRRSIWTSPTASS